MTKVSSDLEMTPQTRRENRSLSFSSHQQHGRLGGLRFSRIATILVLPDLWKSQPKLRPLPLAHSFPSGQG